MPNDLSARRAHVYFPEYFRGNKPLLRLTCVRLTYAVEDIEVLGNYLLVECAMCVCVWSRGQGEWVGLTDKSGANGSRKFV